MDKFLVCAWNGLEKPADKYTKKTCSQAEWEPDKLAKAVKRMLRSRGLEAVDSEIDADLIVLVPRHSDLPYQISDARIFHRMLCGSRKYVLLIDRLGTLSVSPEIWPKWFHCIKDASFDSSDFSKFTQWIKSAPLTQKEEPFDSSNYRDLGCKLLAETKYEFPILLTNAESSKLSRSGTCLLLSDKLSQFFYGLLRMSCRYDRLEHDMNRDISDVFTSEPEPLRRTNQQKKILDFCVDLKRALRVPIHEKTNNANGAENNGKLILVIDDRPDLIHNQIKKIQEIFFPDFSIYIWKPSRRKNKLSLSDIEKYNSLAKSELVLKKTMPSWPTEAESEPLSFKKILDRTRIMLVDILFPDDEGKDKPQGIAVIRGLQRLAVDRLAGGERIQERKDKPLDIVALSRADDMDKIQAVLQAGACGYVFKSRLLALPAVLGEMKKFVREPITNLKRNFRLLYNLPNETIYLLRAVHIPSVPFHGPCIENSEGHQREKILPMARLLAAFPKADLHVHVGSCMSPEFLVISSLVMLVRHKSESPEFKKLRDTISYVVKFWERKKEAIFEIIPDLQVDQEILPTTLYFGDSMSSISNLVNDVRKHLKHQIDYYIDYYKETYLCTTAKLELKEKVQKRYKTFRSILHKDFGIPDHIDEEHLRKRLDEKFDVSMFQFAMTHSVPSGGKPYEMHLITDKEDVLRIFLLFLANKYEKAILQLPSGTNSLLWFKQHRSKINAKEWDEFHDRFWSDDNNPISYEGFRRNNWALKPNDFFVNIELPGDKKSGEFWPLHYVSKENPIAWQIATGTRCTNLKTYLEGCEYSGAEHLRHPFLIHLYAQQTVHQFVTQGVMYAELRAAVSGYEYKDFTFQDACDCMCRAFQQAQSAVLKRYEGSDDSGSANDKPVWLWKSPFAIESLFQNCKTELMGPRFPVKVSIILTGKRHKPTRQMLQEAASATMLHSLPSSNIKTAREFVAKNMEKCRIVGFDLAGQEGDYPPHLFRSEFEQISKMHIPITVHAGENAPAGFVESAVLDLRARRLGHGLALADDPQLMNRLREDGVCIELCPVSNFQTNQFVPANGKSPGREYPLRSFLNNGNAVCLNTDNPVISYTNMIKECFQASYAFGGDGLSLWELLRIIRMGFVHSFLSLPERRAMLELADQILFDLFSDPGVVESLRCMAAVKTNF